MTNEERKKASKDQILRYLYSYYPQWRVVKIIAIKKILETKYEFFKDIIIPLKQPDDETGEATIAQEITNGLVFSALSESLQYIEDLFLLVKFSKDLDWFIKNVVTYKAGEITNFVETFDTHTESLCNSFLFPVIPDSVWPNNETRNAYKEGIQTLKKEIEDIIVFFKEHKFFYNQYKHGLTVALRPYSIFDKNLINKKRLKPTSAYLVALDNLSIGKIFQQSQRFNKVLLLPSLTPNIQPHLAALQAEDNLLRFVPYPKGEIMIEDIIDCAMKVRSAMIVLVNNLSATVQDGNGQLWLPKGDAWITFQFNGASSSS